MALNQGLLDAINSGENLYIYMGTTILTAFIGAIPNFISDAEKLNYITLWNFGSFIRIILSGYFLYAVYDIIHHNNKKYYPLLVFIGLHIVMLIITMFSIHDRYQMPQLPFIYILTALGILKVNESKTITSRFYNIVYTIGVITFIVIFNIYR